jgi:poly(3-hydroxybutyrate) depolymerase
MSAAASSPPTTLPEVEASRIAWRRLGGTGPRYCLFQPTSGSSDDRLLIAVHGISRNAREQARLFARHAERDGVTIVAPLFEPATHGDYQRLGRVGRGGRADHLLDEIVAEVSSNQGLASRPLRLFGFSGGGQFVHRYAMAHPDRVAAAVVSAAGWYTFPDRGLAYPYGIGAPDALPGVGFDLARMLRVPVTVLVGERDHWRDPELRASRRIDSRQGNTRIDRGRRWIEAMRTAARVRGLATPYRFELIPRCGHSFRNAVRRGGLGDRVFALLFGGETPV